MKELEWKEGMAETYEDRTKAIEIMFKHLDKDESGSIDLIELTRIARAVNPVANMQEAKEMLSFMDTDDDGEVTFEEFAKSMEQLVHQASPEQFDQAVREVLYREIPDDGSYRHPKKNVDYLEKTLLPTLRNGMEELVHKFEADRLNTASWVDFKDGFLPDNWMTFQVIEWMADYLQFHNPAYSHLAFFPKRWDDLEREEKLEMVFHHLDRDGSGSLTQDELLAVASKLNPRQDALEARKQLEWMDTDGDNQVSLQEYTDSMVFLMSNLDDAEFEANIQDMLASTHLSYFSREQKLDMVFKRLDKDGSGILTLDEMIELATALNPKGDITAARKTIAFMDKDGDHELTKQEFHEALTHMCGEMPDEAFDMGIHKLLTAEQEVKEPPSPLEGLPPKLTGLVTNSVHYKEAKQMGVMEAMPLFAEPPEGKRVIWVDCRAWEEALVGSIPGAQSLPICITDNETFESDAATQVKWFIKAGDPEMKKDLPGAAGGTAKGGKGGKDAGKGGKGAKGEEAPPTAEGPKPPSPGVVEVGPEDVVVCFDHVGTRSQLAAIEMEKRLGQPVHNLTGGLIQWFNSEGEMQGFVKKELPPDTPASETSGKDSGKKQKTPKTPPAAEYEQKKVESIHPYHKRFLGFIKRKNQFNVKEWIKAQNPKGQGEGKKGKKGKKGEEDKEDKGKKK